MKQYIHQHAASNNNESLPNMGRKKNSTKIQQMLTRCHQLSSQLTVPSGIQEALFYQPYTPAPQLQCYFLSSPIFLFLHLLLCCLWNKQQHLHQLSQSTASGGNPPTQSLQVKSKPFTNWSGVILKTTEYSNILPF